MAFYVFVFSWTWCFWIAAAALQTSVLAPFGHSLLLLGLLGPSVGGVAFAWAARHDGSWREYWSRLADPTRIVGVWWLVTLLFVPALTVLVALLAGVSGDAAVIGLLSANAERLLARPSAAASFLLTLLVMGPLPEELGWRGYALDRLQARYRPRTSGLVLGVIWALWHLPLFFMKDMLHGQHGFGSIWFWLFMVQVPCMSVVMTWLFNNTRRSTLAAILFHFSANFAFSLANVTQATNAYATLLWLAAAGIVAWYGRL